METSQILIITFKTKQAYVLSKKAIQDMKEKQADFDIVFQQHKYKYLFGKAKPVHEKFLIRLINIKVFKVFYIKGTNTRINGYYC